MIKHIHTASEHSHTHNHEHQHTHGHAHDQHEPAHGHAHSHKQSAHTHEDHDHVLIHAHDQHGHPHEHYHQHKHISPHKHETILTVRASSGLSGDMLLSGLAIMAGLDTAALGKLTAELNMPELASCLSLEKRSVNAISGWGCAITLPHEHAHRNLTDIEKIIAHSAMPQQAKELSGKAFRLLAEAEAAVHDKTPDEVTFHEVGALDSILDICLVCHIFTLLAPERFICSPLPLADGVINCAHGKLASPAPAVLRLLTGIPVRSFAGEGETVTPTALALLKTLQANFGPWPQMLVERTAISFGSKIFKNAPNGAVWALGSGC